MFHIYTVNANNLRLYTATETAIYSNYVIVLIFIAEQRRQAHFVRKQSQNCFYSCLLVQSH